MSNPTDSCQSRPPTRLKTCEWWHPAFAFVLHWGSLKPLACFEQFSVLSVIPMTLKLVLISEKEVAKIRKQPKAEGFPRLQAAVVCFPGFVLPFSIHDAVLLRLPFWCVNPELGRCPCWWTVNQEADNQGPSARLSILCYEMTKSPIRHSHFQTPRQQGMTKARGRDRHALATNEERRRVLHVWKYAGIESFRCRQSPRSYWILIIENIDL